MSSPALELRRWEGPQGWQAGLVRLAGSTGPVLFVVDVSGSLAGGPLARAVGFAAATLTQLARRDPARPCAVIAAGATAGLVAPLAPAASALAPTLPGLLARVRGRERAALGDAIRLARVEVERAFAATGPGLAGSQLVLLSDLILDRPALAACAALGAEGARLHAVRVPSHLPDPSSLPPAVQLPADPLDDAPLAASLADTLVGPQPRAGRLRLRLDAAPSGFFLGRPGAWRWGGPAHSGALTLSPLPPLMGWLATGSLGGEVQLEREDEPAAPVRFALQDLEPLETAWSAGLAELIAAEAAL